MNDKVTAKIVSRKSKKGNEFTAVQFSIDCGNGLQYTTLAFPSSFELAFISRVLSPLDSVYGSDTSLNLE